MRFLNSMRDANSCLTLIGPGLTDALQQEIIMKVSTLVATRVLATVSAGTIATELDHPSNAEEGARFQPDHVSGKTSRAQIVQNVMGAQAGGSLHRTSRGDPPTYPLIQGPKLGKSRHTCWTSCGNGSSGQ